MVSAVKTAFTDFEELEELDITVITGRELHTPRSGNGGFQQGCEEIGRTCPRLTCIQWRLQSLAAFMEQSWTCEASTPGGAWTTKSEGVKNMLEGLMRAEAMHAAGFTNLA